MRLICGRSRLPKKAVIANCLTPRFLAQVLGSAQRIIRVKLGLSNEKFSPRKVFPTTPKTLGDHLMVKRLEADLTQAEVAVKMRVSDKTLRAWEYDQSLPSAAEWQRLIGVLPLADLAATLENQHLSSL
jgi:DNA-binding XRE family transcriptional regulator